MIQVKDLDSGQGHDWFLHAPTVQVTHVCVAWQWVVYQKTLSVSHKQGPNGLSQSFFKFCISHKKSAHWPLTIFWPRHLTIGKANCLSQNTCKMVCHKLMVHLVFHNVQPVWSLTNISQLTKQVPQHLTKEMINWSLTNNNWIGLSLVPITGAYHN